VPTAFPVQDWISESLRRSCPAERAGTIGKGIFRTPPNKPAICNGDKMIAAPVKQSA
jgi:hypothetical protein